MSDKYIIKNCPNCLTYNRPKAICGFTYKTGGFKGETTSYKHCQDCTDCVLKQIVKLCKKAIKDCDKCKGDPETDCYDCTQGGKAIQSDKILELLDIQEVE